ncbi:MAG: divalent-cation tolerance protein CutA [Bryobacteraceae bacterium]
MTDKIVVLSASGSEEEARRIARRLVEKRVAACVNVVPGALSVYPWQGKIEESAEWLLVIKSSRELFDRLRAEIEGAHSYQIPEVIAMAVVDGSRDYLGWMDRELSALS